VRGTEESIDSVLTREGVERWRNELLLERERESRIDCFGVWVNLSFKH
jgi:hypothetical protein